MRSLTDHRLENGGFEESIQGVVRSSPWWTLSLIFHALAALILWSIPALPKEAKAESRVQLAEAQDIQDIDEPPPPEPPREPDPDFTEVPVPEEHETPSEDPNETEVRLPEGPEGVTEGEIEGPSHETPIGLLGGAGSGLGGPGGMKRHRGPSSATKVTEIAVDLGLKWLADHQDVDGHGMWDCDGYMKHDPADDQCDGPGKALYDPGVTGLALLAFLGAGHTDRGTKDGNPYAKNVRQALRKPTRLRIEANPAAERMLAGKR